MLYIADTLLYLSAQDYSVSQDYAPNQQLVELICNKLLTSHQAQSSRSTFSFSSFFSSTNTLTPAQISALQELKKDGYETGRANEIFEAMKPTSISKFPNEVEVLATLASKVLTSSAPGHAIH